MSITSPVTPEIWTRSPTRTPYRPIRKKKPDAEILEFVVVFGFGCIAPTDQIALVDIEENRLLAERQHHAGDLPELCGEGVELAFLLLQCGCIAGVGGLSQFIASLQRRHEALCERS